MGVIVDRKSTRLNSSHLAYTRLFRSVREGIRVCTALIADQLNRGPVAVLLQSGRRGIQNGRDRRSEEHTSELQSLSLHEALPICKGRYSGLHRSDRGPAQPWPRSRAFAEWPPWNPEWA